MLCVTTTMYKHAKCTSAAVFVLANLISTATQTMIVADCVDTEMHTRMLAQSAFVSVCMNKRCKDIVYTHMHTYSTLSLTQYVGRYHGNPPLQE